MRIVYHSLAVDQEFRSVADDEGRMDVGFQRWKIKERKREGLDPRSKSRIMTDRSQSLNWVARHLQRCSEGVGITSLLNMNSRRYNHV